MTTYTGLTFGGTPWIPLFVQTLNQAACIGCGRCYKVCPRDVLTLVDRTEALGDDFEEDEDSDMDNTVVMAISNLADCIGCEACSKVCPKKCFAHASMAA